MSIYCSTIDFTDSWGLEDDDPPIIYQGSHVLPTDDDPRGGGFDLGEIPGFIYRDDRPALDEHGLRVWPWLRVSVGENTVVLDRRQVAETAEYLAGWLERTGAPDGGE